MEGDSRRHRSERRLSPISIHSLRMEGDCIIEFSKHNFDISIHSLHTEGDLLTGGEGKRIFSFQSTPSTRRETVRHVLVCAAGCDFNPLPPHGGRRPPAPLWGATEKFQSTPSAWRETAVAVLLSCRRSFQSTPSAWRETAVLFLVPPQILISIHSLRMEGDTTLDSFSNHLSISIHSLRMEGDFFTFWNQSSNTHFNPLPPHGGRR